MAMEKRFNWDPIRNRQLLDERAISFEDVVFYIQKGGLLDILNYTKQATKQSVLVVEMDAYIYLVPYIEIDGQYFMQTITPSRKATRQYLRGDV